jgi:apolipoprotein N-acyltransferase
LLTKPLIGAAGAGVLLAASFPKMDLPLLAWLAPALILFCGLRHPGAVFRIGYVAGLAHNLVSLHWLLHIPVQVMPILGWLALSAYLALFPAAWLWLAGRLAPSDLRAGRQPEPGSTASTALEPTALLSRGWGARAAWAVACAAVWVALEMAVGRLLSGFPWNFLGASQFRQLPLIQIASFTGIYGVSFLVVWFSAAVLSAALMIARRPTAHWAWLGELIVPLIALGAALGVGAARLSKTPPMDGPEIHVAMLQPAVPQTMIWDPAANTNRFRRLLELSERALSEQALATKPDLLIWPEAAVPGLLRFDESLFEAVSDLARRHGRWILLGADDAEPTDAAGDSRRVRYYNSSFLVSPAGTLAATYRKQRLVAFGEYVPLSRWLPFLRWFTPIPGGFTPGPGPVQFRLTNPPAQTSVLICFEDIFPHLARRHVGPDTDFLVNLTNDGWFGESAAQWQHAASAVFRAVENGRPLIRCTNNGLTCWIDAQGRLHAVYFDGSTDVYQAGLKFARVPLLQPRERGRTTFYQRHGDWFGGACVALAGTLAGVVLFREWRTRSTRPTGRS